MVTKNTLWVEKRKLASRLISVASVYTSVLFHRFREITYGWRGITENRQYIYIRVTRGQYLYPDAHGQYLYPGSSWNFCTEMSSIDEKRVYSATEGKTDVFVATGTGVARVECSGDRIGSFRLVQRCSATDIASEKGRLAVATDEDVLVWNQDQNEDGFEPTGFGPASAVGYHDTLIAAGEDKIARYDESGWNTFDELDDVRAIDGDLLAAASGTYQLTDGDGDDRDSVSPVGLDDANDVSTAAVPLVATAHGLYQLANGWVNVLSGNVSLVASDGRHTHAVADETLYDYDSERAGDEWRPIEIPVEERITGIAYGESGTTYTSTVDGTFLIEVDDGWRTQSLGLTDICGLAVP
jgi:hypothetical protein